LPCFLSSFLGGGALPPFLFLSSITSAYSRLKTLKAYENNFSSLGNSYPLIISSVLSITSSLLNSTIEAVYKELLAQ
jgi:hypothetical protein